MSRGLTFRAFVSPLAWIDGRPLASVIEGYRWAIFDQAFQPDPQRLGALLYDLILTGRAKKNWKSADLVIACLYALMADSPGGNQCYLLANDEGQAKDDLELARKLIRANPILGDWLTPRKNVIERRDGEGFIECLPAQDVLGAHGKTYRFRGHDEIHGQRDWDLLEALAPDPTRPDCQTWITSYASVIHRPGAPLFDLLQQAKAGADARMLFSWYAADYCTDPAFRDRSPEERANPSMTSWDAPDYLEQQRRRLPAHKYRRLHLNLPGVPEGSAFQPESVMDAVERGVAARPSARGIEYRAFVDMSGGSSDDAVLTIGHLDTDGRAVLDRIIDQGGRPPFDPIKAVERFVSVLREYGVRTVTGDRYAGETFKSAFESRGIRYTACAESKSQLYEQLEPALNGHRAALLDVPQLAQQLLGLVWRGGRIDHPAGEHDDFANAAVGVLVELLASPGCRCGDSRCDGMVPLGLAGGTFIREWRARHPWLRDEDDERGDDPAVDDRLTDDEAAALLGLVDRVVDAVEAGDPEAITSAEAALDAHVSEHDGAVRVRLAAAVGRVRLALKTELEVGP